MCSVAVEGGFGVRFCSTRPSSVRFISHLFREYVLNLIRGGPASSTEATLVLTATHIYTYYVAPSQVSPLHLARFFCCLALIISAQGCRQHVHILPGKWTLCMQLCLGCNSRHARRFRPRPEPWPRPCQGTAHQFDAMQPIISLIQACATSPRIYQACSLRSFNVHKSSLTVQQIYMSGRFILRSCTAIDLTVQSLKSLIFDVFEVPPLSTFPCIQYAAKP
jgi:hypothetical protein